ncbi:hypothetical protein GCM10025867_08720 [Frondihabitans sucicola]|uniref:IrrE N-terminal-like domain-containing protein n=1 Tax=Frondihabitans sucicola TaxID=1268041 RepID=A0ABN6XY94_9MICO|nr:ImmA/IrrE family metallo-endopeptidase [Frondihabitans sucicola]BDZ48631.1 hypothetical protein GCM10025867_08720 [Frondihabitans sucicola]
MTLERWTTRAIDQLSGPTREAFVLDPIETIRSMGISVRAVDSLAESRQDGGMCDGVSYLSDGVVLYAPTDGSRRENFTVAHELGHWLVEHDDAILDWVANRDESSVALETLCDRIAQRLLLPDDLIDSIVSNPVRAQNILDLYAGSAASRPAAAIAVASRLKGLGAIVIIDRPSRSITSSSVVPDPELGWPKIYPWRGQQVDAAHTLVHMNSGDSLTRRSFWRSSWDKREDFYIDAVADDRRIYAVLADADLWKVEPMPVLTDRAWDTRLEGSVFCCGMQRAVRGYPCSKCQQYFCPKCGNCRCTRERADEELCITCNTLTRSHLLVNGQCEMCA